MAERFDVQLLDGLKAAYKTEELREVCFRLGVDYEGLKQDTRDVLARELIDFMRRNGRLNELVDFLRADRPHVPWPDPPDEVAPHPAVPLQRPPEATHFTGRGLELEQLLDALQPGRVVTLYGPGGIGKTALAAEALRALAPTDDPPARFLGGVFFHTFYGRPAAAEAAAHVARSCHIDPNPDPFAAMAIALRGRVALLIFDGAEEADDLDALLERRGRCGVLITSRRRADVRETGIEVERLPPEDALTLLRALAHERAADEAAARAICDLVGNLPLALRLAGAFMFEDGWSAAEYQAWLCESGLAALDFGQRRRESVPILMAKSVAQVSAAARAALGVAGCLALAPFDVAPVAAALEADERAARRALGELHNYELLRRPAERYETAHALVHAYAREQAAVEATALRRLGDYYAALTETESEKGLPGYQTLNPERAHILAVLQRMAAAGEWAAANRLVWAVQGWLDIQGYPRDRIATLEVGLAAARALGTRKDEGAHLTNLGNAFIDLGQVKQALEHYEAALTMARELGDRRSEGNALGSLGRAYYALGQVKLAIVFYEAALAIAQEFGDQRMEGNSQGHLGNAYYSLGQFEHAIGQYEGALSVALDIGDRRQEGAWLGNLGNAYHNLGQVERAIEFLEAALAVAREIGDRRGEGNHLSNLGNAYYSLGQVEQAIEFYEAALVVAREIGDRREEGNRLGNLGIAYYSLGQAERAIEFLEAALAVAREIGDRRGEGNHLSNLGIAYYSLGQVERAIEFYEAALVVAREIGDRREEGNHLYNRGLALEQLERRAEAIASFEAALAVYESINAPTAAQAREQLARLRGDAL